MANLKQLNVFCGHHFLPVRMYFSGWAGPYRPIYRCPWCQRTKVYHRGHFGGQVHRVR